MATLDGVPKTLDTTDAFALSTLVMEGCTMSFDSCEIKSHQLCCEQVFIFKALHFDGTNIEKLWQVLTFFSDRTKYNFTLD